MKTKKQLINNIIGQLEGISKMLEAKKDCLAVLVQMQAVKSAFNNLINKYLEEEMLTHLKGCSKEKNRCRDILRVIFKGKYHD